MNEKELKSLIKEVVRECVTETSAQIPKGKLSQLNPNIVQKQGDKKMKLPPKGSSTKPSSEVKEAGAISEYSEDEEIRLIRGLNLITKKLLDMHQGMDSEEHEEVNESKKKDKKPSQKTIDQKRTSKRKALAKRFKKGLEEVKQECELFLSENNGGPQYKVVSPNAVDTAKEDKAREIQRDPKVTESNHKVQHRSAKTVKDLDNNPKNVRDPEVPQA